MSAWLHWTPPSPKSYILTFFDDCSLKQSLRAIQGAVSYVAVLILSQMKLNLQLSHCASFLVDKIQVSGEGVGWPPRPVSLCSSDAQFPANLSFPSLGCLIWVSWQDPWLAFGTVTCFCSYNHTLWTDCLRGPYPSAWVELKCLCLAHREIIWPCPPVNGCKRRRN